MIKKVQALLVAGVGVVLMIAAHGLVAWSGLTLIGRIAVWLPWIAGGALALGMYYVIQHIRSGRRHAHRRGSSANDRGAVEHGPHGGVMVNLGHGFVELTVADSDGMPRFRLFFHDKEKRARAGPRNATVTIETVRGDVRAGFAFQTKGDYLEATTDVPAPHEFQAVVYVSHGAHTHTHETLFSARPT